jgi:hypothetical protein
LPFSRILSDKQLKLQSLFQKDAKKFYDMN